MSGRDEGAVLGIDYGSKRIGLSVSDPGRVFVFSRPTLSRTTPDADLAHIQGLAAEDGVALIALGLPLNADGSEGAMCQTVRKFQLALAARCGVPVALVDERYTSQEADEHLRERHPKDTRKRRAQRDQAAAALILRSYLEEGAYEEPHRPSPPAAGS